MPNPNEENVIVIESEKEEQKKKDNKKLIFILIALLITLLILLLLLLLVVLKEKKKKSEPMNDEIKKITKQLTKKRVVQKDELKALIKKANYYYYKGDKEKALAILNKISQYSEAISYYNLGVIKIEEKKYKKALEYFKKAIQNEDNRALSAINAAFCALKLGNKKEFDYYAKLAYSLMDEISNLKSYPFYYALIMYYNGYEFNALQALVNYKTPYEKEANELKSAIYEYFNQFEYSTSINPFYKGLSLANIGEYVLARNYLLQARNKEAKFALALVDLKLKNYKDAGKLLKQFEFNNIYPINMYLRDSLFDLNVAQKRFKKEFLSKNSDFFDLYFYYAPYKVFNIEKVVDYLKKGSVAIPANSLQESKTFLSKTATYAKLNLEIAKALRLTFSKHILLANKSFIKLAKKRPYSYVVQYNLALSYAQLKDYKNAYKHFLKAYHLNPNDLYAGIFAYMCLTKLKKENKYLIASIKDSLNTDTKLKSAMVAVIENNFVELSRFSQNKTENKPFYLITKIAANSLLDKPFLDEAKKLNSLYKNDLISNLLLFYAKYKNLSIKEFALKFQPLFLSNSWDMKEFFYGPTIAREWFFEFSQISGMLYRLRDILIDKSKKETFDLIPILKNLAYVNLYTRHFEEAYVIYNDLINNKNITDPKTLYNGAVSAIGANHHANAVALMELAKLKNPNYYEARYGLGLLWQEANNLRAASIQYLKIPDGFESRFFDFQIKPK